MSTLAIVYDFDNNHQGRYRIGSASIEVFTLTQDHEVWNCGYDKEP